MRSPCLLITTLAATLLAAVPAAAADRTNGFEARIVNGHAPAQAWPAQTSVRFTIGGSSYVCGGTLVSARWVLTAGHCATGGGGAALTAGAFSPVRVGSTSRTTGGTTAAVDDVVRHPSYTAPDVPRDDLALLHLASAVPQEPLRLIGTGTADAALWGAGAQATIIGWGVTETGSQSTTLVEAQAPIVGDSSCASFWTSYFGSTSMVCAGGATTDTCGGDSGGPLMVPRDGAYTIVGVTSWGSSPCGQPGVFGVYARLGEPALNAWVRSRVPTAELAVSPAAPAPGEQVNLSATVAAGSHGDAPSLAWDLDDDGSFNDATGATASAAFATAGGNVVRVQATFADGDRAVAREVVSVSVPGATTSAPEVVVPPATTTPQRKPQLPAAPQQDDEPIGSVAVPARMKLRTLRGKNLRVRVRCERACTIAGRLTLDATTARRVGLDQTTIGRGSEALASAGADTMTVRLTARAKHALRNRSSFTIRLATELRSGAASLERTRKIAVSR